ncbi:MAG TPA: protease pro-enzyme activation domain-containing protein [Terriglobales bacterium]|jgi:subtilase family serine protease|nr:protease pro-enzyme activation domain-containing protein [Terriglobales bacterium]
MRSTLRVIPIWLLAAASAFAAQPNRIPGSIDGSQTVVLNGSVHAQARPEYDQGAVLPSLPLPYVVMLTKPSAAQQADLDQFLAQQQDPTSRNYHKWLTPEAYADRFGLSPSDTEKISVWLRSQGFTVVQVARGRDWIAFSATAGLIENAFHTQIHRYSLDGELHFANATELTIPKALAGAVTGLRGLDDFRWKPMGVHQVVHPGSILPVILGPLFTTGGGSNGNNFLAPDDFATIYDLTTLYQSGIDGAGMKLVVVGQVTVVMADIQAFRSGFNLPTNNPTVTVVPGTKPGTSQDDLLESDLDLEWSGAIARNASIIFVTSNDVFSSATYAIDNDLAPVISMSYGGCESINAGFIAANEPSMQKANAEGITFLASSGDSGPANCDDPNETSASQGLAVSYPASSPEVTGIGGTEFSGDLPPNTGLYWNTTNGANGGSAIMYIPETSWNDAAEPPPSLASSGGGKSSCHASPCSGGFPKPSWQAGPGVPADKVRDVPDISFNASADHDGYIVCSTGGPPGGNCPGGIGNGFLEVGGTSASTPVFAGILTLLNQQLGNLPPAGLGNVNPTLYKLAQTPAKNVFHDITTGNNIVPCTKGSPNCPSGLTFGYSAGVGYDLVTGLGSIDVNNLFNNWNADKVPTSAVLSVTPITIGAGSTQSITLTVTVSPNLGDGTPSGSVTFFLNGTTSVGNGTLSKGSASLSYNPKSLKAGTNTFTASYGGDVNFVGSKSSAEMVTVQDFTVALPSSPTTVTVSAPGGKGTTKLTITPEFGFDQAVSFSCTGLPSEATCISGTVTPNGAPVMTTLTITTTAPSASLRHEFGGGGLFYALLLPGLLGVAWLPLGNRKSRFHQARLLGLTVGLICLSLWVSSCGGTSTPPTPPNPGTPVGTTTVSIVATGASGAPSHSVEILLTIK